MLKLRKTSCWKCAKGLKMIIIEKNVELDYAKRVFQPATQHGSYDAEGYETSSWRSR
ncbi:hypothetical protein HanPI659440_Chr13g0511641 [Helianthus annuus]|nr:hypothetical protein HanPI659440_Chr13g0511641 [Helianthus annuus]